MSDVHSAEFGHTFLVKIEWSTDFDGRVIDPGKEEYPETLHGPFDTSEEAVEWMNTYPDDPDIYEMTVVVINRVKQETE